MQSDQPSGGGSTGRWLKSKRPAGETNLSKFKAGRINPEVLASEQRVGQVQLEEIRQAVAEKSDDVVMILLGGRGAQALSRLVGELAQTSALDDVLGRLHVFTQDALAPLGMDNP